MQLTFQPFSVTLAMARSRPSSSTKSNSQSHSAKHGPGPAMLAAQQCSQGPVPKSLRLIVVPRGLARCHQQRHDANMGIICGKLNGSQDILKECSGKRKAYSKENTDQEGFKHFLVTSTCSGKMHRCFQVCSCFCFFCGIYCRTIESLA